MNIVRRSAAVLISVLVAGCVAPAVVPHSAHLSIAFRATQIKSIQTLYVSNRGFNPKGTSILTYPVTATGDYTPSTTIQGSNTGLVAGAITVDSDGDIYTDITPANNFSRIGIFAAGSHGNIPPTDVLTGPATEIDIPLALAFDSKGDLFVGNYHGGERRLSSILEFAPGADGDATPIGMISGPNTGLGIAGISGIAFDGQNDVYVLLDGGQMTIEEFKAGSTGNVSPMRAIGGSLTELSRPNGFAVGQYGEIRVANAHNPDVGVLIFGSTQSGNVAPQLSIMGSETKFRGPTGIAIGFYGNSIVADGAASSILTYKVGEYGNIPPLHRIWAGKRSELEIPEAIAVH